jgi:hypothetical protein
MADRGGIDRTGGEGCGSAGAEGERGAATVATGQDPVERPQAYHRADGAGGRQGHRHRAQRRDHPPQRLQLSL